MKNLTTSPVAIAHMVKGHQHRTVDMNSIVLDAPQDALPSP